MNDIFSALRVAMPFDRFSGPVLFLWIIGNVLFLTIWAIVYRRKAWLTFEIYFFAQQVWLPIFFMLPFVYSDFNFAALDRYWWKAEPFIAESFLQGVLGVVFTGIGYGLSYKIRLPLPGLPMVYRSISRAWVSSAGMIVGCCLILAFLLLFVALGMQPFNARGSAILDRQLLPIYNFFQVTTEFLTLCAFTYFYTTRRFAGLACILVLAFAGTFTGARGPFLFFALQFFVLYAIVTQMQRIGKALLLLTLLAVFAVYMSGWRYGNFALSNLLRTPFLLLYGNNFSDLRDYALTLSGWDGQLLWGKTFLAGFLTGLPGFSDFRGQYSWGFWVLQTALGFIMQGHPGMRPILYGEWYVNFGYSGLCIAGLFYGFLVGRLAAFTRAGIATRNKREAIVAAVSAMTYWMIASNFLQSGSFFIFHVLVILIIFGFLVSVVARRDRADATVATPA